MVAARRSTPTSATGTAVTAGSTPRRAAALRCTIECTLPSVMLRHAHGSCHEWKSCLTGARFPRASGGGGTVRSAVLKSTHLWGRKRRSEHMHAGWLGAVLKSTHQSFQLTSRGEGLRQWRNCRSWSPRPSQPGPMAAVRPMDEDELRAANVEQSSSKHSH